MRRSFIVTYERNVKKVIHIWKHSITQSFVSVFNFTHNNDKYPYRHTVHRWHNSHAHWCLHHKGTRIFSEKWTASLIIGNEKILMKTSILIWNEPFCERIPFKSLQKSNSCFNHKLSHDVYQHLLESFKNNFVHDCHLDFLHFS